MTEYAELFRDRFNTPLLADAAFRAGIAVGLPGPGIRPLDPSSKLAGPAVTVSAKSDLVAILEAVDRAGPGDVVVINNEGPDAGCMGDLIGTEAVRKGLAGFLVDGMVRDSGELVALGIPVWCRGTYPMGPLKLPGDGIGTVGEPVSIGGTTVAPGTRAFGDVDGVVFVEHEALSTIFEGAGLAADREDELARTISSGTPLAEAIQLQAFLEKRDQDRDADFNRHLAGLDRAI